jgi:ABC-type nickel/cobalt efflux system permease component RcnA
MALSSDIRRRGFRKWYERELLRSHSHLVLLLLCALAALGAVEAFGRADSEKLLMAASLVVAAGVGAWAVRRYLTFLMRAELIANQADCPSCHAYGRWGVESEDGGDEQGGAFTARCRACQHCWRIEW